MSHIESVTNKRVKAIVKLRNKRTRDEQKLFLIEGRRELERAIESGVEVLEVYSLSGESFGSAQCFSCSEAVFDKIALRERGDNVLAIARQWESNLSTLNLRACPLVVVIEAVEKPGNLGAILRTCDGAGVDAVLVADAHTDIFHPNVVRSSLGALFTRPVLVCSSDACIEFLKKHSLPIVAATPSATKDYDVLDYSKGAAIAVGSEDRGLSLQWLSRADECVRIPMRGAVDSLNVSVAAALLIYEGARHR